jgi:hypothetical protein
VDLESTTGVGEGAAGLAVGFALGVGAGASPSDSESSDLPQAKIINRNEEQNPSESGETKLRQGQGEPIKELGFKGASDFYAGS